MASHVIYGRKGVLEMEVKYILETVYLNGDKYMDKFDTIYELVETLRYIDGWINERNPDHMKLDKNQISVTTEEV